MRPAGWPTSLPLIVLDLRGLMIYHMEIFSKSRRCFCIYCAYNSYPMHFISQTLHVSLISNVGIPLSLESVRFLERKP